MKGEAFRFGGMANSHGPPIAAPATPQDNPGEAFQFASTVDNPGEAFQFASKVDKKPFVRKMKWGETVPLSRMQRMPRTGQLAKGRVLSLRHVALPEREPLHITLLPRFSRCDQDNAPCMSGFVSKPVRIKYYGTIRVHGATHCAARKLTRRGSQDLPNNIFYDPTYQQRVQALSLPEARWVSPSFAHWLMGLPPEWADAAAHIPGAPPQAENRLTGMSLFTGVGGLDLGLRPWVAIKLACECSANCRAVLAKRMSEGWLDQATIVEDVCSLVPSPPSVDLVTAGFPCQDVSVAGEQLGFSGARSRLVKVALEVATKARAGIIFLENVGAICHKNMTPFARGLLECIQTAGYTAYWTCIRGTNVGSPQTRERWFCLAWRDGETLPALVSIPHLNLEALEKQVRGQWRPEAMPPLEEWLVNRKSSDVDQLRMLGNAVIPEMAAVAFQVLVQQALMMRR